MLLLKVKKKHPIEIFYKQKFDGLSPSKMPCRCTGVRRDKCKCVLETAYPLRVNTSNIILVGHSTDNTNELYKKQSNRSIALRILEGLYEKCAEYNLR